ncbi:sensor histidine kinase [Alteromonas lipolytica]|uniref:Histidine kinase domain-containing protein n=1 Tax=Alteromonas lipolytica TaxID=1856405 RepID=A0A1E8FEU0_9ALTE|nr:HAMP domain-containing sensor histidine kinase [Alteromonas lipolytica]OFI34108.1 hypothetical protein BFC17_21420 [Alteromonas lipolytica]GGF65333.1 hypothetical protein GCM10011338_17120 [Alteromonas lipolytica]
MPNQFTTYFLGGIFVVVITIVGASVSQTLLDQEEVVSFEAPIHEFIDTLSREVDYNAFALNSLAQLFRSSTHVEAHEFASYASLVMAQFYSITAMAYLSEQTSVEEPGVTQTYWQDVSKGVPVNSSEVLVNADINVLLAQASQRQQAVASPIFKLSKDPRYFAFVLMEVAPKAGFVGILVDVGVTLERNLNNQLNQGYTLFEYENSTARRVFSRHDKAKSGDETVNDGDFARTVAFFNRQWTISAFQNEQWHRTVAYKAIPFGTLALSSLVVYLVVQAQRLKVAHRERKAAFKDLQFAQQKLIETEKLSAMRGVVAGVAHEVNTPLGIGITSASHLQESMTGLRQDYEQGHLDPNAFVEFLDTGDEMVSLTLNNLYKASSLVARFKKVDIESCESSSAPEPVVIAELVDVFIQRFYNENPNLAFTIKAEIDQSATVITYPSVLLDIFHYLASNSIVHAFLPNQQHCEISITFPAQTAGKKENVLLFKDNGVGVEKALLKRLVDPFFTTRRGAGSTGLGLSVVYNLVKGKLNSDLNLYVDEGLAVAFELHDLNK